MMDYYNLGVYAYHVSVNTVVAVNERIKFEIIKHNYIET